LPWAFTTLVELVGVDPAGVPVVGPVHEYVAPGVVELPSNKAVGDKQLIVKSGTTLTCGVVKFAVGVTTAVFVHPFTVLVVSNVYVPGAVIVAVA
jgi:hypothetical protein